MAKAKKSTGRVKRERHMVAFTEAELAPLKKEAERRGVPLAVYMRMVLLESRP